MSRWRARAALVLACLVAYANAPMGAFHYDDQHAIVQNPFIRSLANVPKFFADPSTFSAVAQNQQYRPLLLVSYALGAQLFGVRPAVFIFGNLLIHIANVLLFAVLFARVRKRLGHRQEGAFDSVAFFGALIFAVHPLLSECINYPSARSESLSALFMLAALVCFTDRSSSRTWLGSALAAATLAFAAMFVKMTAVVTPLLSLVLMRLEAEVERKSGGGRRWWRFAVLCGGTLAGAAIVARMTPETAIAAAHGFSREVYFFSELPALWHYVRLFLLPLGQSGDPAYPCVTSIDPAVMVSLAAWIAVVVFSLVGLVRRRHLGLSVVALWFLICLLPSSSVFPLAEIANEHRPYLATCALAALAAELLCRSPLRFERGQVSSLAQVAMVTVTLVTLTLLRNRVWKSEETFWLDVVTKSPWSASAHANYGRYLLERGEMVEAEAHLRKAVELDPENPFALIDLGQFFLQQGRATDAIRELDAAVASAKDLFYTHYHRGLGGMQIGEPAEKVAGYFREVIRQSPSFPDAHYRLAQLYLAMGEVAAAQREAARAIELRGSPDDEQLMQQLRSIAPR